MYLPTCYEDLDDLAYGHSKDNDGLPQINVGILMSRRLNLPLMHMSYNSSINDGYSGARGNPSRAVSI